MNVIYPPEQNENCAVLIRYRGDIVGIPVGEEWWRLGCRSRYDRTPEHLPYRCVNRNESKFARVRVRYARNVLVLPATILFRGTIPIACK